MIVKDVTIFEYLVGERTWDEQAEAIQIPASTKS
jgi:phosphopantothenate synthetase